LYGLRLLILGLIGAIAGTLLSILILPVGSQQRILSLKFNAAGTGGADSSNLCLKANSGNMPLKTVVQQMAAKIPIYYQGLFCRFIPLTWT